MRLWRKRQPEEQQLREDERQGYLLHLTQFMTAEELAAIGLSYGEILALRVFCNAVRREAEAQDSAQPPSE